MTGALAELDVISTAGRNLVFLFAVNRGRGIHHLVDHRAALEGLESSQIFPIYSVGVVAVSSLLASLIFNEKLSRQKMLGLVVGMTAVALLNR